MIEVRVSHHQRSGDLLTKHDDNSFKSINKIYSSSLILVNNTME